MSWQNLTDEGRRGKAKTWPFHGRAWLHLNKGVVASFCFSWHLWSRFCGVSFSASPDHENSFAFMIALPPLAFWLTIDARGWLASFARWLASLQPSDMGVDWSGRELSLRVHDTALWWKLWVCDYGWTRSRPKWRDGSFHPLGHNCRQGDPVVVEKRDVLVPMPERAYKATATLERVRFGWDRLPRFFDKETLTCSIEMHEGEQIPFPGKGTASYNCGEDAAFGLHTPAKSIEDGVGKMVASVLIDRRRNPR